MYLLKNTMKVKSDGMGRKCLWCRLLLRREKGEGKERKRKRETERERERDDVMVSCTKVV